MLSKKILTILTVVFAALSSASPLEKVYFTHHLQPRTLIKLPREQSPSSRTQDQPVSLQQFQQQNYRTVSSYLLAWVYWQTRRQPQDDVGGKADAAGAVAEVIGKVVDLIQGLIDGDTAVSFPSEWLMISCWENLQRRQRFTQETVSAVSVQFPGRSVVMSNVGYSLTCTPEVIQHTSYKAKVGSNVRWVVIQIYFDLDWWKDSYDVLIFGSGCTFTLKGDGGFQNVSLASIPRKIQRRGNWLNVCSGHISWRPAVLPTAGYLLARTEPSVALLEWE